MILTLCCCKSNASIQKLPYNTYINLNKFDSICIADTLPHNINLWHKLELKNFESKDRFIQYMYYKNSDIIYIIDSISIIKRFIPQ